RSIFQRNQRQLQNMFAGIELRPGTGLEGAERVRHYNKRSVLADLRKDFVLTLALHDAKAALEALAGLKVKTLLEYDPIEDEELQVQVTTAIVTNSPDKSYTVAREQLDANGLNYQFIETLKHLYEKDPALAANLAKDVLGKIKNNKLHLVSKGQNRPAAD